MTDKIKIIHIEGAGREIDDDTKIVRYMKLETLLLLLFERWAFIPSHATLGRLDRLETEILFDIPDQRTFWGDWVGKIGPRMEDFMVSSYNQGWIRLGGDPSLLATSVDNMGLISLPKDPIESLLRISHKYVNDLANERCIWCWNEFTNYSHALWQLYGERGVAITSTVGHVREALAKAGVERGIVAPIAYVDHENSEVSKVLLNEETIFRPYILKSIAYDYEKEIRFVVAAQSEVLRAKGGVLVNFEEADFFKYKISPYMNREERLIVDTIISTHLNKPPKERLPRSSNSHWTEIYNRYNGTPFLKDDRGFSDLS